MDTIYWAVKLTDASKSKLLGLFPAKHSNVYAEHMTIAFKPPRGVDEALMKECGSKVNLEIIGYAEDEKGQAVVVNSQSVPRIGGGTAHITISCADGTKPFYSNKLVESGYDSLPPVSLVGIVARFTNNGWDMCEEI